MRKVSLFVFAGLVTVNTFAAVKPSDLIKVTPENNPKCVEFYEYKGDMYCSTKAKQSNSTVVDPHIKDYEKQKITFDDRVWQAAWGKKTNEMVTVEYIPSGDNIDHWNELVTSQYFPNLQKVTPRKFVDIVIENLKESGFKPIVHFIEESPEQVIFEYQIKSPKNFQQDELQKVVLGKDGLYILHYVIKKSDMGSKNRKIWIENLKKSTLRS